jgi:hypothetical protein
MADPITKLLPIRQVKDPGEERRCYEQLGLCSGHPAGPLPGRRAALPAPIP